MVCSCNMRCLKSNNISGKEKCFSEQSICNYFSLPTVASSDLCNQWTHAVSVDCIDVEHSKYGFAETFEEKKEKKEKPLKTTKYVPQIQ